LLTGEGVLKLKILCIENLDLKANDEDEIKLLNDFVDTAKEEGFLLKTTAKAQKDIFQYFRYKRNYLKSQVRLRILQDLTNKTPEQAIELPITVSFLRETLGVVKLSEDCLLIIYNYAYIALKYINKELDITTLTAGEQTSAAGARKNPWEYTMQRVEGEKHHRDKHTRVKQRLEDLLNTGQKFVPL